jgi:hypothetical protein
LCCCSSMHAAEFDRLLAESLKGVTGIRVTVAACKG